MKKKKKLKLWTVDETRHRTQVRCNYCTIRHKGITNE